MADSDEYQKNYRAAQANIEAHEQFRLFGIKGCAKLHPHGRALLRSTMSAEQINEQIQGILSTSEDQSLLKETLRLVEELKRVGVNPSETRYCIDSGTAPVPLAAGARLQVI